MKIGLWQLLVFWTNEHTNRWKIQHGDLYVHLNLTVRYPVWCLLSFTRQSDAFCCCATKDTHATPQPLLLQLSLRPFYLQHTFGPGIRGGMQISIWRMPVARETKKETRMHLHMHSVSVKKCTLFGPPWIFNDVDIGDKILFMFKAWPGWFGTPASKMNPMCLLDAFWSNSSKWEECCIHSQKKLKLQRALSTFYLTVSRDGKHHQHNCFLFICCRKPGSGHTI